MFMIDKGKLEDLLIRNWASFFDIKKLVVRVLRDVNAAGDTFHAAKGGSKPDRNTMQVSLSRFHLADTGFELWVEFVVPRDGDVSVGTVEYLLSNSGLMELRQIMGTRFNKSE